MSYAFHASLTSRLTGIDDRRLVSGLPFIRTSDMERIGGCEFISRSDSINFAELLRDPCVMTGY